MRVLVTGACGFIGSNLIARCLQEGWSAVGVDDLSNGHLEFLPPSLGNPLGSRSRLAISDFASEELLRRVQAQSYDVVYHLAAVPRVGYSVEHPLETNDANVTRTLALMEACRGNVGRMVFASSSSVYGGASALPTHESSPKRPRSPYALQKSIIEDYLSLYGELYGLESVCLRFFNVFGPNQLGSSPYATAVASWLTAALRGTPLRSDGDGTQTRDMCYVDNVVEACVLAGRRKAPLRGARLNVACGEAVSNADVLRYVMGRFPGSTKVDAPWRPGDVMHTLADVGQAKELIGYEPRVRFWDGLERTVEWATSSPWFLSLGLRT